MNISATLKIEIPIPNLLFPSLCATPEKLLMMLSEKDVKRINSHVVDKLTDRDGGPTLTDLQIHRFRVDADNANGSFRLNFRINRQYCCSDVSGCTDDYLEFRFMYAHETLVAEANYFPWSLDN